MDYLSILMQILSAISSVASALASAEETVLPVLQSVWTDLQAAYAAIVSAFQSGTTLNDDQLAKINNTLASAKTALTNSGFDEFGKKAA